MDNTTQAIIAFQGSVELLGARWDLSSGYVVDFRIHAVAHDPDRVHPMKRFTKARAKGYKDEHRVGTRFAATVTSVERGGAITYVEEVMLASWSEGEKGQTARFFLFADGAHPFAGCRKRQGGNPGEEFILILVELDENEQVINQAKRDSVEAAQGTQVSEADGGAERAGNDSVERQDTRKGRKLSASAYLLITQPLFFQFLSEHIRKGPPEGWNKDNARSYVKWLLKIESLSELDYNPAAAESFHEKIRRPFARWNGVE